MSGTLNRYNAGERGYARNIGTGHWVNLIDWFAYKIILDNPGTTDVDHGTILIECAQPDPNDPCAPGPWGPLEAVPMCNDAPWIPAGNAEIVLSPGGPNVIMAGEQCSFSAPCPCPFLRVDPASVPAGLEVIAFMDRPVRTGGPLIPIQQLNPCGPGYSAP